ncbi:MAG: hypothetical protein ACLFM5_10110 [Spirochaetaceae bacterium]
MRGNGRTLTAIMTLFVPALVAAAPVAALDFGGTLGNTTELTVPFDDDFELGQGNRTSLYLRHFFGEQLELVARGRYEYRMDTVFGDDTDTEVDWWQGDLDALYARARLPVAGENGALAELQAGRFRLREFSGDLLAEPADGLRAVFRTSGGDLTLAGGYTGFLMKESSSLLLSGPDLGDDADDDTYFAPPRALALFELSLPEIIGRQNVNVAFVGQGDLRDEDNLDAEEGLVHNAYLGAGVNGPLVSTLFYDVYGYFGGGSQYTDVGGFTVDKPISSFLVGANLQYFMPEAARSMVSLGYLYSSGDKDRGEFFENTTGETSTMFVGLTPPAFGAVFSPRLGNLMVADASYSLKPFADGGPPALEQFQAELSVLNFFRPTTGVISEVGADTSSDALYLGSEADLALNFRPFSDLGFSLVNGVFIANDEAFLDDTTGNEYVARLEATFSF